MREYEINGELLDESVDLFEKRKKHGATTTYTTGDLGYNIKQFNKRLTGYGNDNNNPSTEEAKARAAAAAAAEAAGTFASQSPDGGSSIDTGSMSSSSAGGDAGGDAGAGSGGAGLGEAVELDEYKIPKNVADMYDFFHGTYEECKDFIQNKLKPSAKNRWVGTDIVSEGNNKYSVAYCKDDLITEDMDLEEANNNLSPEDKMKLFDQGLRRENVKACGDQKLKDYHKICVRLGLNRARQQLETEMLDRGLPVPGVTAPGYNTGSSSATSTKQVNTNKVNTNIDYAQILSTLPMDSQSTLQLITSDPYYVRAYGIYDDGLIPENVFEGIAIDLGADHGDDPEAHMRYLSVIFGLLLLALVKQDVEKIAQLKAYFKDKFNIDGPALKAKLLEALDDPEIAKGLDYANTVYRWGQKNSTTTESLTEAKRYVRRYYIRPQNIFCSNKAEILKALVDYQDENCSIYTLNNLGDEKDVTKLTNKDIIYYYDEGILYDKNHVKVMDYDLYIKHEENRDEVEPDQISDKTFADIYDDRITKATELEEGAFNTNPVCSLDELRDKLLDGLYIVVGTDQKDADTEVSFSDNSHYSHTNYEASYEDGVGFTVQGWLVSDDGTEEEGERTDFDTFEELVEWINGKDFDECYVTLLQSRAVEENNPLALDFPDIDAKGNVLHEGKEDTQVCCICGEEFKGYGNNPEPYMSAENGERCCDACNAHFVIPARYNQMEVERNNSTEE